MVVVKNDPVFRHFIIQPFILQFFISEHHQGKRCKKPDPVQNTTWEMEEKVMLGRNLTEKPPC